MNLASSEFVTPNAILADILKVTKDENFRVLTEGHYTSLMQQALEELSFDTFFDQRYEDFTVPENLNLEMPKGAFNVRNIYLYNGTECSISSAVNVYYKRNYWTGGNGYLAKDRFRNINDPFHVQRGITRRYAPERNISPGQGADRPENVHYYNIVAGVIHLSENCRRFQNIRIEFNGVGCEIGDAPVIPKFFRQYVKHFVLDYAFNVLMAEAEPKDLGRWQILAAKNDRDMNRPYEGSKDKAEYRVKRMDKKAREDMKEYFSRMNY